MYAGLGGKFRHTLVVRQVIDEYVEQLGSTALMKVFWNTQKKNRTKSELKWLKLHVVQIYTRISIYGYSTTQWIKYLNFIIQQYTAQYFIHIQWMK